MKTIAHNIRIALLSLAILVFFTTGCQETTETTENPALPETLLLKDFRPVSIYNVPVTEIEHSRFPAIDMHAHDWARSPEGLDNWVELMDEAGIEKVLILTHEYGPTFDSILDVYSRYPDRFEVWCGFDYSTYEDEDFPSKAVAELIRCYEKGAGGVGELGDKGKGLYYSKPPAWGMHSDDPKMDQLWEKCGELGLPVNIHVADPKWMYNVMDSTNDGHMNAYSWRLDDQPDIVDHQGMVDILERTVKKHPNTTFIACHLANCSYDLNIIAGLIDQYPNLHIDISARFAEICATPRATSQFIEKYQDRIVYGTDMRFSKNTYGITFRLLETADEHIYDRHFSYHWPLHGLDLSDEVLEKIYRLNAMKLLN